ncbi:MAG: non-heme iron oxygenase ferredoxin subunit [candidate division Zixibacteria bacterium]|nr:non-heme iron oxygenase ferredoxin subunit [candidate division Zixibacteria bacterium]
MAEYQVANAGEIPAGKSKVVKAGGKELLVCNVKGEFFCIDNVCTHDYGLLGDGEIEGEEIECPLHGARFNIKTGDVIALPAVDPIKTYPVRLNDGHIIVTLE